MYLFIIHLNSEQDKEVEIKNGWLNVVVKDWTRAHTKVLIFKVKVTILLQFARDDYLQ